MTRLRPSRWFLGTQGWNYPAWVGPFYPRAARAADFLGLYARIFDSVEVDSTFYAVPSAAAIESWARRTPPAFRFALKFPREATHEDRLATVRSRDLLRHFVERVRPLGPRLGPVLLQLPPDFGVDRRGDLDALLDELPADVRFAVEFRDPAWFTDSVWQDLATRHVASALTDSPFVGLDLVLDFAGRPGTDFAYVRWLGTRDLTDYSRLQIDRGADLDRWAEVLAGLLSRGMDVYGYFNNHYQGHSPASARAFLERVGITPRNPEDLEPQRELF